jgi:hypothetical protein
MQTLPSRVAEVLIDQVLDGYHLDSADQAGEANARVKLKTLALISRAFKDPAQKRLFALVHVRLHSYSPEDIVYGTSLSARLAAAPPDLVSSIKGLAITVKLHQMPDESPELNGYRVMDDATLASQVKLLPHLRTAVLSYMATAEWPLTYRALDDKVTRLAVRGVKEKPLEILHLPLEGRVHQDSSEGRQDFSFAALCNITTLQDIRLQSLSLDGLDARTSFNHLTHLRLFRCNISKHHFTSLLVSSASTLLHLSLIWINFLEETEQDLLQLVQSISPSFPQLTHLHLENRQIVKMGPAGPPKPKVDLAQTVFERLPKLRTCELPDVHADVHFIKHLTSTCGKTRLPLNNVAFGIYAPEAEQLASDIPYLRELVFNSHLKTSIRSLQFYILCDTMGHDEGGVTAQLKAIAHLKIALQRAETRAIMARKDTELSKVEKMAQVKEVVDERRQRGGSDRIWIEICKLRTGDPFCIDAEMVKM